MEKEENLEKLIKKKLHGRKKYKIYIYMQSFVNCKFSMEMLEDFCVSLPLTFALWKQLLVRTGESKETHLQGSSMVTFFQW